MTAISRIIFQQGIDIRRDERGAWYFPAADPAVERLAPQAIMEKFDVLPVLAYQRAPNQPDIPMLLPKVRGNPFGIQLTGLSQTIFLRPRCTL